MDGWLQNQSVRRQAWPDSSLPHDEQLKHLFEEGSDKMLLAQNREFAEAGRSWSKGQKVKKENARKRECADEK